MWVGRLELVDVRSYEHLVLELGPGVTVLVGANGQGKTNLVEALHRVATGSSHRVSSDAALVRAGAEHGIVRVAAVDDEGRERTVDLELGGGRRARPRVDGQPVRRTSEAVGVVAVVLFAPEDVAIVRGDPSERRRFLDDVLAQRRTTFATARADYDQVLRQRNALLRAQRSGDAGDDELTAWTELLVAHGAPIVAARIAAVSALAGPVDAAHRALVGRDDGVTLEHTSTLGTFVTDEGGVPPTGPIAAAMRDALVAVADEERRRGMTLVGPHRDDLTITLAGMPARTTASQGEAWSLALALRVASAELIAEVGPRPVAVLDDVFSELDADRRARVAALCDRFDQVLVTAAVDADVPLAGRRIDVRLEDGRSRVTSRGSDATGGPTTRGEG